MLIQDRWRRKTHVDASLWYPSIFAHSCFTTGALTGSMIEFAHSSAGQAGYRNARRLLRFSLLHWRGWLGLLLLTLSASVLSLLQPWPMRMLVDGVLGRRQVSPWMNRAAELAGLPTVSLRGFAALIAAAGLLLFVMNALLDAGQALAWVRLGQEIVYDLARKTFARIQRRSLLFHSRAPVGDSMNRITTDTWCTITLVESLVLGPPQSALYIIGAGAVMVRLNWHMATAALVTAPAMAIGVRWVGRKLRPVARAKREADSRVSAHVQQTLSGIQVVQAFGREREEHARFRTLAGQAIKAQRHAMVLGSLSGLWIGLILTCGNAVVLLIGGSRVLAGDITVGGWARRRAGADRGIAPIARHRSDTHSRRRNRRRPAAGIPSTDNSCMSRDNPARARARCREASQRTCRRASPRRSERCLEGSRSRR